jgi:hypothetical protein
MVFMAIFFVILVFPLMMPVIPPVTVLGESPITSNGFSPRTLFKGIMAAPDAYTQYFNEHFALRDRLVEANNLIRLRLFHEREFANVLIGEEDWLYYTGEDNIRDFECTSPFNSKELAALVERLRGWDERLGAQGIQFYFVIAPNKESIYPQYLPDYIKTGWSACRMDQLIKGLETTKIKVLDLRQPLLLAAEQTQVYHRTDTHWNDTGALVAVREMMELIKQDFPKVSVPCIDRFTSGKRSFSGDLASFIPEDPRFVEQAVFLSPVGGHQSELTQGEERQVISQNADDSLPNMLVFRDSFSDALIPFLADHFSRGYYVHAFMLDFDLIEKELPDIVILEVAQRYLGLLR